MNGYGHRAQDHWAEYLPQRYAAIEDRTDFFTLLGEEVAREINVQYQGRLTNEPAGMDAVGAEGWRNAAMVMAAEQVMAEMVFLAPEHAEDNFPVDPTDPLAPLWALAEKHRHEDREHDRQLEEAAIQDEERAYQERQDRGWVAD